MHGEYKVPGGKLVVVDFTLVDGRFTGMQISGDFFLEPDTVLECMHVALEGMCVNSAMETLAGAVRTALSPGAQLFGITPEAVAMAVRRALDSSGEIQQAGGVT